MRNVPSSSSEMPEVCLAYSVNPVIRFCREVLPQSMPEESSDSDVEYDEKAHPRISRVACSVRIASRYARRKAAQSLVGVR